MADDNPISAARAAAPDLDAHARALVDAAPPLTPRQRDRLAALLTAHRPPSRHPQPRGKAA